MDLFRFGQKVRGFRGFSTRTSVVRGFRGLSTRTSVIRGLYQDVHFPEWKWQSLSDHAAKYPLVSTVRGGLIEVDQRIPFKISDHWHKLLFSAFLHSVICKRKGDCIQNAYDLGNIGVIEGLNILGFRRFQRIEEMKNINHEEFILFVHNLFAQLSDASALEKVSDVNNFLGVLSGDPSFLQRVCDVSKFTGGLPDLFMLCNPVFLNDNEMANFYVDAYRLVRHQFPVRNAGGKAANILKDLERIYWTNDLCVKACQRSLLLQHLLGGHEKTAEAMKRYKEPRFGSAVVDIPRIAVTHCIEINLLEKARSECTSKLELDLLDKFSREDLIEGVRHMFDLYPQTLACSFLANRVWPQLRMEERLPIPSIYGYVSPGDRMDGSTLYSAIR